MRHALPVIAWVLLCGVIALWWLRATATMRDALPVIAWVLLCGALALWWMRATATGF